MRRRSLPRAAIITVDRTVGSVDSPESLAALADDLEQLDAADRLERDERAELELLVGVSQDVSAGRLADSLSNRVTRLRAAEARAGLPNQGSAVLSRHRPAVASLVGVALAEAELEQRAREPVPRVYRSSGTPLDLGTAVEPSTFKGRREIFSQLELLLGGEHRETVVLHGPRRHGKTSVLKQLPGRLGPSVVPVFVDLQGDLGAAESVATLLTGLAGAIANQASSHRVPVDIDAPTTEALAAEPYVAFGRWLDRLEEALGNRHVLLCLDEFETIQEQMEQGRLDTRILDLLRGIAQHRRSSTVLLSGLHDLPNLPRAWASRLVSATSIEVGPLEWEEAKELIEQPVPGFPPVYSDDAVASILRATTCQPYLVQVLCSVIVEALNDRHWREDDPTVSAADVTDLMPDAVDRASNYFFDQWTNYVPDAAKPLLRLVASGAPPPEVAPTTTDLVEALLALRRHRITAPGTAVALVTPMFREYIRSKQSMT